MVNAIIAGRKTQTRRVVKLADDGRTFIWNAGRCGLDIDRDDNRDLMSMASPYGMRGDTLWVRETFRICRDFDGTSPALASKYAEEDRHFLGARYEADGEPNPLDGWGRRRPAIHMPRWASRITLRVTSVRVERLGAIGEGDAMAEGFDSVSAFFYLWDEINGPRPGCAVSENPWVWVVGFERIEVPHG
jgi:hypothetical protein